jgi:hypothetical protein
VPRAELGWALLVPLAVAGAELGLLVSHVAALAGLVNSIRMARLPDPQTLRRAGGVVLG